MGFGFFLFGWVFSSARFVPCAGTYPGWVFEVEEDASYLVVSKVGFVVLGTDTTSLLFFFFLREIYEHLCLSTNIINKTRITYLQQQHLDFVLYYTANWGDKRI